MITHPVILTSRSSVFIMEIETIAEMMLILIEFAIIKGKTISSKGNSFNSVKAFKIEFNNIKINGSITISLIGYNKIFTICHSNN